MQRTTSHRSVVPRQPKALALLAGMITLIASSPALAHHGKDFMLTSTDDIPLQGHVYALVSVDDTLDPKDGSRTVETTPGLLFSVGPNTSLEPHVHLDKTEGGGYGYAATAVELRHRFGFIGKSDWRVAASVEFEIPRVEDNNIQGRIILVHQFPQALFAGNLVLGRSLTTGGPTSYGIIAGVLTPLNITNNLGLEITAPFPLADGVEILPGIYHTFGGPAGTSSLKAGVGLFRSRDKTAGTFHMAFIHRF